LAAMKYHIYISASGELRGEVSSLEQVVWELGHIPVRPSVLNTENDTDNQIIHKNISESDYFLLLVAHKWNNGRQKDEYERAIRSGVPVIAFIIDEKARWKAAKCDTEREDIDEMASFKEILAANGTVASKIYWQKSADLPEKCREALTRAFFTNTRQGWVKSTGQEGPELASLVGRLVSANEELKQRLHAYTNQPKIEELSMKTINTLETNSAQISFFYLEGENWEHNLQCSYLKIFKLIAPEIFTGKSSGELARFLAAVLNPELGRPLRREFPVPSNTIKKIMADFNLLNLCNCINHGIDSPAEGAAEELWELSAFGREVFSQYRFKNLALP
jgi:hypothetical protein